jgi:hypothetical protein
LGFGGWWVAIIFKRGSEIMKIVDIHEGEVANKELRDRAVALVTEADSLITVILSWLEGGDRNTIDLFESTDEDDGTPGLGMAFEVDDQQICDVFVNCRDISPTESPILPITDFIIQDNFVLKASYDLPFIYEKKLRKYLGFKIEKMYCDYVGGTLVNVEQSLKLALTYAFAKGGEARFSHFELYDPVDTWELPEELIGKKLLSVNLEYMSPEPTNGVQNWFGGSVYIAV